MGKVLKVPVVIQLEALECGAASLAMILAFYGKWVPLEKVRSDCGVSRDGSNLKYMAMAARSYGLEPKALKCNLDTVKEVELPAIIHWNFNHFVVLNGFTDKEAIINDPARGTVKVSMKEFDESFTGVIVSFNKTDKFTPGGKPDSVINFAMKRLSGTTAAFLFVISTTLITTILSIISPAFSRIFNDRILEQRNPDWLYPFLIGFTIITAINIIVTILNRVYMLKIQGKFAIVANSKFVWHVLRLPMNFFSQRMVGDIMSRQSSNEGIANMLIGQFAPLFLDLGTLIFYLFVMIRYNFFLSLIGIASAFFNMYFGQFMAKKRANIQRVQTRDAGKAAAASMSGIEMIETIKASGAENGFFQKWSGYQSSLNSSVVKFEKLNQYLGSIAGLVGTLSELLIRMICIFLIITDDNWSIGKLTAFMAYLGSFMGPIGKLTGTMQSLTQLKTDMERIQDVFKYKTDVKSKTDEKSQEEYKKLTGSVELKEITFGYNKLGDPLIENFNLSLKPGARVALIGFSGCGKSTLAKLISGLYKPWSGEILFDNKSIDKVDRDVLTGSLAVVDQDITMFADSIADNIKMWDNSIEDFEMILAARDAQIHEDILTREGGYNYKVLEGGKDFSGGQRQRFEIARVLAQDPTIIVLDEATSALDAKTEFEVAKAIKDRGITCVIVAHRLSTIRDCDEIIVMEKGKVMERGTHEELYGKEGLYRKLIATE